MTVRLVRGESTKVFRSGGALRLPRSCRCASRARRRHRGLAGRNGERDGGGPGADLRAGAGTDDSPPHATYVLETGAAAMVGPRWRRSQSRSCRTRMPADHVVVGRAIERLLPLRETKIAFRKACIRSGHGPDRVFDRLAVARVSTGPRGGTPDVPGPSSSSMSSYACVLRAVTAGPNTAGAGRHPHPKRDGGRPHSPGRPWPPVPSHAGAPRPAPPGTRRR